MTQNKNVETIVHIIHLTGLALFVIGILLFMWASIEVMHGIENDIKGLPITNSDAIITSFGFIPLSILLIIGGLITHGVFSIIIDGMEHREFMERLNVVLNKSWKDVIVEDETPKNNFIKNGVP
jgi:hypothetical protein